MFAIYVVSRVIFRINRPEIGYQLFGFLFSPANVRHLLLVYVE